MANLRCFCCVYVGFWFGLLFISRSVRIVLFISSIVACSSLICCLSSTFLFISFLFSTLLGLIFLIAILSSFWMFSSSILYWAAAAGFLLG